MTMIKAMTVTDFSTLINQAQRNRIINLASSKQAGIEET